MAKEKFKDVNFKAESLDRIKECNDIIDDYMQQGLRLTLRQLYYQLVTKNVIPNVERSYKNLSTLVTDARLAGLMDWDAIEDRVRQPLIQQEFDNLKDLVETAIRAYRLPRWRGQENYVELWVEKDALAGVLRPLATQYHVTLMVNRGYSSASAMYESANRYVHAAGAGIATEKTCYLLYLGDHDPSGEDMVRDVRDRLRMFGSDLHVKKIALTMPQVKKYNPPPNPAKVSDPRAEAYIREHGDHSWEVDALPPNVLSALIKKEIEALLDKSMMEDVKEEEEQDKEELRAAVAELMRNKKHEEEDPSDDMPQDEPEEPNDDVTEDEDDDDTDPE